MYFWRWVLEVVLGRDDKKLDSYGSVLGDLVEMSSSQHTRTRLGKNGPVALDGISTRRHTVISLALHSIPHNGFNEQTLQQEKSECEGLRE